MFLKISPQPHRGMSLTGAVAVVLGCSNAFPGWQLPGGMAYKKIGDNCSHGFIAVSSVL